MKSRNHLKSLHPRTISFHRRKQLIAICEMCGKRFERVTCGKGSVQTRQRFCGSRVNKQGCSYIHGRQQQREWNSKHAQKGSVENSERCRAYYKKNRDGIIARVRAYQFMKYTIKISTGVGSSKKYDTKEVAGKEIDGTLHRQNM